MHFSLWSLSSQVPTSIWNSCGGPPTHLKSVSVKYSEIGNVGLINMESICSAGGGGGGWGGRGWCCRALADPSLSAMIILFLLPLFNTIRPGRPFTEINHPPLRALTLHRHSYTSTCVCVLHPPQSTTSSGRVGGGSRCPI